jgi:uncharacterized protein (DUF2235 family)
MARRIIICSDGTWNQPDQKDRDKYAPSNVVHMARSIKPVTAEDKAQVVYYDPGVGTGNFFDKITGGAFGQGLDQNVVDNYRFIIHNFSPGDEIYLFGFSRGAYTVRSTAGLIRNSGVLKKQFSDKIPEAMNLYRSKTVHPNSEKAKEFREKYSQETRIKFIGVWDTVGALGIPIGWLRWLTKSKYEFHDVQLSSWIDNAYHALAIDEKRKNFKPTLWEIKKETNQNVEQRWFSGVHTNIGGGYTDSGLSDLTFMWIMDMAEKCGLELDRDYIKNHIHPAFNGELRNSKTGIFKLSSDYIRPIKSGENSFEDVDNSAVERKEKLSDYKPENLIHYLRSLD